MRIVDAHAYDGVARVELGALGPDGGNGANETVTGGQRSFFLHWISPEAHVDIGAAKTGVEDADLGVLGRGRGDAGSDDGDVGGVAEGADDGFPDGSHGDGSIGLWIESDHGLQCRLSLSALLLTMAFLPEEEAFTASLCLLLRRILEIKAVRAWKCLELTFTEDLASGLIDMAIVQ